MLLNERIRQQRKGAGLSQEKLAELVGVSRQAVAKWEQGLSAPSTENLFRLAEIFGTTVDLLLSPGEEQGEERGKGSRLRSGLLSALAVAAGYLVIFLAGHIFGTTGETMSVVGWLTETGHLCYLMGWLLKRKLFWIAMALSVVSALFGAKRFSFTTLGGFGLGILAGELFGKNPAGEAYGQGHYGWAIWGCLFLFSALLGAALEWRGRRRDK